MPSESERSGFNLLVSGAAAKLSDAAEDRCNVYGHAMQRRLVLCYKWIAALTPPAWLGLVQVLHHLLVELPMQDTSLHGDVVSRWFV